LLTDEDINDEKILGIPDVEMPEWLKSV